EIFVAYSTSGDYEVSAEERLGEATQALSLMGVDKNHIIVLGYPDTYQENCYFYSMEKAVPSPHGRTETYAPSGFVDYAKTYRGGHSLYARKYLREDLIHLLLEIKADIIFCVDLDCHLDHKALSIVFEEAMGAILREKGNTYQPEVYKKFAYTCAWHNAPDFYADNLLSVKKPQIGATPFYGRDIIGTSFYDWDQRVRFPVPMECRGAFLDNNPVFAGICAHRSQHPYMQAKCIINSDEVFFQRRTDSLSYQANVTASSGDASKVNDFQLLNLTDIHSMVPKWEDYLWLPDKKDKEKKLTFKWDEPQNIAQIRLWGNIDGGSIKEVEICFDNGFVRKCGSLPHNGKPFDVLFSLQKGVQELTIKLLKCKGDNCGFAEVEIFSDVLPEYTIRPFIKLTVNDDFVYVYKRRKNERIFNLGVYGFKFDSEVNVQILNGKARIEKGKLEILGDEDVVLQIQTSDGEIYDRVIFRVYDDDYFNELRTAQVIEQKYHGLFKQFEDYIEKNKIR
ncbi:MAG: PIG-L family deacetylase, partial [Selenomonadaceae bacterium]|nr:PIG-L family deacetylase [Selenomonadaceae bacterium]